MARKSSLGGKRHENYRRCKKRGDHYFYSQIRLSITKKMVSFLELENEETIYFSFFKKNPFSFFLSKDKNQSAQEYIIEERKIYSKMGKYKYILCPSSFYSVLKTKGIVNHFSVKEIFHKRRIEIIMESTKEMKKNVILLKVNKGGTGKTFLSCQLGHGLSLLGKKVLIITSDSQNNVLNFLYQKDKVFEKGLLSAVLRDSQDVISLRENLDFIPLESNRLGKTFVSKLEEWLNKKREEYDYILIDSVPTMKIDSIFVRLADHIIIPTFCDEATIEGVLNLLEDVDIEKVFAIQVNRFKPRKVEMKYLNLLKEQLNGLSVYLGEPIKDLSFVASMLDKKKSVWEYENKKAIEVQNILMPLLAKLIEKVEKTF
ncbi:MAG: ParA family protein [Fusobacterium necrophorum]|nr:ParA family protein [Fusobacterium necrophorum]